MSAASSPAAVFSKAPRSVSAVSILRDTEEEKRARAAQQARFARYWNRSPGQWKEDKDVAKRRGLTMSELYAEKAGPPLLSNGYVVVSLFLSFSLCLPSTVGPQLLSAFN